MNIKTFSDAMSQLDSSYVEEAARYKKSRKKFRRMKWGALAACVALAVLVGVRILPQEGPQLSILTVPTLEGGAMGFESWMGYDITTWDNGNPWEASMEFAALPVYRNGAYHEAGVPTGLSQEEMMKRLEQTASALAVEVGTPEMVQEGAGVVQLTASAEGITIVVEADGTIEVRFEEGVALPEQYHFTASDTTDDEAAQALDYLAQRYAALLKFAQPEQALSGTWTVSEEDGSGLQYEREYVLYDAAGDDLEDLLNYTYRTARFYPDENGSLSLIRIADGLCCAEKLGEYPVITVDEAFELLERGSYITTVPYEITDMELVGKVELVYRNSRTEETFLPYYRFYVALPEKQEDGLTIFGAYYVPAVEGEYLSNMPLWNGNFD